MYQFARKESSEEIRAAILAVGGDQVESRMTLSVVLAGEEQSLKFVGTHFFDLRVVISES